MEKKTRSAKKRETRECACNNNKRSSCSVACGYRTLLPTVGWSVIPILNTMQKVMGDMLANADLGEG